MNCMLWLLLLLCSAASCFHATRTLSRNLRPHAFAATRDSIDQHVHVCSHCRATFASRNALFRHVRNEHVAWGETQRQAIGTLPDRKVALCLGYATNATDAVQRLEEIFVSSIPDVEAVDLTHATSTSLDRDCGSLGDVVVFSYNSRYQIKQNLIETLNEGLRGSVRVLQVTELSSKSRLDAETSCTQYVYHYLLPLSWLPHGEETTKWWLEREKEESSYGGGHVSRKNAKPSLLKRLKQVLSSLESLSSNKTHPSKPARSGRFGTLADKPRLSFHNYNCSGIDDWKSVDRVQMGGFVSSQGRVSTIIELRGESPLPVRHLIGTVVAILWEWLPANFWELSTQPDSVVNVPLAPPLHYLAGCRYDFDEVRWGHKLFEGSDRTDDWKQQLQDNHWSNLDNTDQWLQELEIITCPAIKEQLRDLTRETLTTDAIPREYCSVLSNLRHIVQTDRWPPTSAARSRILRKGYIQDAKTGFPLGTFTVVNNRMSTKGLQVVQGNQMFPDLVNAVFSLEYELIAKGALAHRSPSTHCAINFNAEFTPHLDSGTRGGDDVSLIVGMDDYEGGRLIVNGKFCDIRYQPLEFDGWNQWHWTETFQGDRFTLVFFTPALRDKIRSPDPVALHDKAQRWIQRFAEPRGLPSIQFRSESTDTLVVQEVLEGTCVYNNCPRTSHDHDTPDFSPKGHVVLDIGAHIGVFSWYALGEGCKQIMAFEPEGSNFDLLVQNMQHFGNKCVVHQAAVAHGQVGKRPFVLGSNNQLAGTSTNTWRHSLVEYSTYSEVGEHRLVDCFPFFGPDGVLTEEVTFVKLDCEGAELDILLSDEARHGSHWCNVTKVVFEWSFTKHRSTKTFHDAIHNLRQAGFEVRYEGQGAWWDTTTASDTMIWPYHNDLLVFALRDLLCDHPRMPLHNTKRYY
jgi:FkbM family methyltransferase